MADAYIKNEEALGLQYFRCRHPEHCCSGSSVAAVPHNSHCSVMCVKNVCAWRWVL